jgi:hypothetical protein
VANDWAQTADLLERLAALVEQQPNGDDPLLDLTYVPRSALGSEHRWEVNLNLGPEADVGYWTGPTPQEALRAALEELTEYLGDPAAFMRAAAKQVEG